MAKAATLKARTSDVRKAPRKPSRQATEDAKLRRQHERQKAERDKIWSVLYFKARDREREAPAIVTMEDAILALGGPPVVQTWLGWTADDMAERIQKGWFEPGYHLRVYLALTDMGHRKVSPRLFGLHTWEDIRPPHAQRPALPA